MGVYDPATFGAVLGEVIGLLRDPRDWGWAMRLLPAPLSGGSRRNGAGRHMTGSRRRPAIGGSG